MAYVDRIEDSKKVANLLEIASPSGRIMLVQFTLSDVDDIFQLIERNRAFLSQHGDITADKYKTAQDVAESIHHPSNPERLRFAIRDDGVLLGSINLTPDKDNPARGEVGYYLDEEATGRGYATEATATLSSFAFSELGYDELYAKVVPENEPSARVLLRAGYEETGGDDGETVFTLVKPDEEK